MDCSPLHKLPPELRNEIYELTRYQPSRFSLFISNKRPMLMDWPRKDRNLLALTKTCKQIRKESVSVFYSVNRFLLQTDQIGHHDDDDIIDEMGLGWRGGLQKWIISIGTMSFLQIRHIVVRAGTWHYDSYHSPKVAGRSIRALRPTLSNTKAKITVLIIVEWTCWSYSTRDSCGLKLALHDSAAAKGEVEHALVRRREKIERSLERIPHMPREMNIVEGGFKRDSCALIELVRVIYTDSDED